jgi:hypothetical protein
MGIMSLTNSAMLSLILVMLPSGCCLRNSERRVEPEYPQGVSGWMNETARQAFMKKYGFWSRGDFVIKRGASVDDGKVQVKLLDLIPPNSCCEPADVNCRAARAVISLVRMSDEKELCVVKAAEHSSGGYPECPPALDEVGIIGIGIDEINLRENWVHIRIDG